MNLEEYPAFIRGIPNCEATMVSLRAPEGQKQWHLFVELKYCREGRIGDYGPKAIDQMDGVRQKLYNNGLLDKEGGITHFNYCSPNNPQSEPFDGFRETQSAALNRIADDGVIFHARMELIALDGSLIIEPPVEI